MRKTLAIDPVTRIEGHAKVFLDVGENGSLVSAGLVVNELRGFERILVGVEAGQMPLITSRICGVCPSAHHLAAAKALDAATGVEPPPAAKLVRELLYMGHFIHSHALSLFVLQGPDLILGLDADPAIRNVVGVVQADPELARKALRCRTLGQKINEMLGGRGTHPVTAVAGGVTFTLDDDKRRTLEAWTSELLPLTQELGEIAKGLFRKMVDACKDLLDVWQLPLWSLGTVEGGAVSFYDGTLRALDGLGREAVEFQACEYASYLTESTLPWSYMKPVHFRHQGGLHAYRVGPLARINVAGRMGTPLADRELQELRAAFPAPAHHTLLNVWARVVELLYAAERAHAIARHPDLGGETRVAVRFRAGRGIGHVEAPRGTLFHEYEIDDRGIVRSANLLVATQQNYEAINRSIAQAAQTHVLACADEPLLNAVEFSIRCYDPCLSCATHALGRMPLDVVIRRQGQVVRRVRRAAA